MLIRVRVSLSSMKKYFFLTSLLHTIIGSKSSRNGNDRREEWKHLENLLDRNLWEVHIDPILGQEVDEEEIHLKQGLKRWFTANFNNMSFDIILMEFFTQSSVYFPKRSRIVCIDTTWDSAAMCINEHLMSLSD